MNTNFTISFLNDRALLVRFFESEQSRSENYGVELGVKRAQTSARQRKNFKFWDRLSNTLMSQLQHPNVCMYIMSASNGEISVSVKKLVKSY